MTSQTIYTLAESNITISGGEELSGFSQGSGIHLDDLTITLNSNAWQAISITENESGDVNFADSDSSQTLDGDQSIDGTPFTDGSRVEAEYALTVEDPDGNTYTLIGFNINEAGVTSYATVEALAFVGGVGGFPPIGVELTVIETHEGPSELYTDLATPPCFTRGCMIDTPHGPVAIEELQAGDLVNTLDHGPQPLRWIGRTLLPQAALRHEPKFRPISVRKDSFGEGRPNRDTLFSPQHRILVTGWHAELLFGAEEILIPVTKLVNDDTIRPNTLQENGSESDVEYFHMLFDHHEIVISDGLATESYQFNLDCKDGVETRREVRELFANLPEPSQYQTAVRPCIADKRAVLMRDMLIA